MALFRKRRPNGPDGANGGGDEPPGPRRGAKLAERLRAIGESGGPPEEALEPALAGILEATGAAAGALCLYDVRHALLRLATEQNLSDDGCRRLRAVRRGDPACWDMPLHGLLNRRAYLIESAARNRYVPALVEPGTPVTTVACLPVYADGAPLGSIILIGAAPRSFSERDVQALWRPIAELARLIAAVRRQAGLGGPEIGPGRRRPEPVDVVALVAERDQLREESDSLRAELHGLRERMAAALEAAAAAQRAQAEREAALVQARADAERNAAAGLAELERLRAAGAEMAANVERRAVDQATLVEKLERRLMETEQALAAGRVREEHLLAEVTRLSADHDDATARLAEMHGELESLRSAQVDALDEGRVEAERRIQVCESARTELRARLEAARAELGQAVARAEALDVQLSETRTALARAEETAASLAAERDALASRVEALQTATAAAMAELGALRDEAARLRTALDASAARVTDITAERDELRAQAEAAKPIPLPDESAEIEGHVHILAVGEEPEAAPEVPAAAPVAASSEVVLDPDVPVIAVLDVDGSWAGIEVDGHRLIVVPPDASALERIAQVRPARIVVNLTAPGALPTMLALRAAGTTGRFWGCIAAGERGLVVGPLEPVVTPLDPDAVVEALGPLATSGSRIVTTGADVDALMSVRQALSRKRASVSMAWDGKQAVELLAVAKPQVVIVDLDLPRRDGFAVLAHLGEAETPPLTIVCGGGEDASIAMAAQLADARNAARIVPLADLARELTTRSEPAPVEEKRPKLRALHGFGK